MGRFRGRGNKKERYLIEPNYWQQVMTKREKAGFFIIATGISVLTGWLFYHSVWSVCIVWPFGVWIYRKLKQERKEKKRRQFLLQFKDMTECVAQAMNVGYSAENAFREALKEIKLLYPENTMIRTELEYIVRKLRLKIPMEQVLEEFAGRVQLEDVDSFTVVFAAAKRSGGDMIAIIHDTVSQISEKIDVKRDIDTILAAKKYEFHIMCVIPYIMILYMQLSFPEFMGVLYGNAAGIGVMTICLGIYAGACMLGSKIVKIDI